MLCAGSGFSWQSLGLEVPLRIGQVRIKSGDILFADCDGVLCIPRALEQQIIVKALEKLRGEVAARIALVGGMSTVEAFAKSGIM